MRVLIIGASKGIGLETTRQALDAGHDVRALARSATAIAISNPSLEKMPGDALKPEDVEAALAGVDVVIQTLGRWIRRLVPACAPVLGRDPSADRGNEKTRCQTSDLCDRFWRWR